MLIKLPARTERTSVRSGGRSQLYQIIFFVQVEVWKTFRVFCFFLRWNKVK